MSYCKRINITKKDILERLQDVIDDLTQERDELANDTEDRFKPRPEAENILLSIEEAVGEMPLYSLNLPKPTKAELKARGV